MEATTCAHPGGAVVLGITLPFPKPRTRLQPLPKAALTGSSGMAQWNFRPFTPLTPSNYCYVPIRLNLAAGLPAGLPPLIPTWVSNPTLPSPTPSSALGGPSQGILASPFLASHDPLFTHSQRELGKSQAGPHFSPVPMPPGLPGAFSISCDSFTEAPRHCPWQLFLPPPQALTHAVLLTRTPLLTPAIPHSAASSWKPSCLPFIPGCLEGLHQTSPSPTGKHLQLGVCLNEQREAAFPLIQLTPRERQQHPPRHIGQPADSGRPGC